MRHFLAIAATELNTDIKTLPPDVATYLCSLSWPGNVRQLENLCRWLTVMASGREIHLEELPPELLNQSTSETIASAENDWQRLFGNWVEQQLQTKQPEIAKRVIPMIETVLIKAALNYTHNRRNEAATLLGYGRNTLTRKIKELNLLL
jgi:two-component system nitrogen regulation response regulator GlnG